MKNLIDQNIAQIKANGIKLTIYQEQYLRDANKDLSIKYLQRNLAALKRFNNNQNTTR